MGGRWLGRGPERSRELGGQRRRHQLHLQAARRPEVVRRHALHVCRHSVLVGTRRDQHGDQLERAAGDIRGRRRTRHGGSPRRLYDPIFLVQTERRVPAGPGLALRPARGSVRQAPWRALRHRKQPGRGSRDDGGRQRRRLRSLVEGDGRHLRPATPSTSIRARTCTRTWRPNRYAARSGSRFSATRTTSRWIRRAINCPTSTAAPGC